MRNPSDAVSGIQVHPSSAMAMESRRAGPRSWVIRWGSRLKFTLRTLLVLVLFIGSAATLWLHWQPWVLERTVQASNDVIVDVHYSPDGRQIAAVGLNAVHILDATGAERAVLQHPDRVGDIVFSPDGHHCVTTSRDHARVWNVETGVEEANLQGHSRIMSAVYSPDGRRILTTSNVDTAEVWDARNFIELAVLKGHHDRVMSAAFSPDASRIVTAGTDGTVRIWDPENGTEKLTLAANSSWVGCVAFSPDGKRIVSGGAALARDAVARVWDAESGAGLVVLRGHSTDVVESAVFSPDGALIVTTGRNDFARVWDARTGALVSELRQAGHVYNASFFPDSRRVITTGFEGNAQIWDARSGSGLAELKVQPSERGSATTIAALSPDHEHIMMLTMNVDSKIWRRDHSDAKYGRLLMPEFWMTLALCIAFVWSVWRDRRLLRR